MADTAQNLIAAAQAAGYAGLARRQLMQCFLAGVQNQVVEIATAGDLLYLTDFLFPNATSIIATDSNVEGLVLERVGGSFTSFEAPNLATVDLGNAFGYGIELLDCDTLISAGFPALITNGSFFFVDVNALLGSISCPLMQTCDTVEITNNPSLASLSLPSLTQLAGGTQYFSIQSNASLVSFSMDSFGSFATVNSLDIKSNPSLTTVSIPMVLPRNGCDMVFTNNALSAESVNHILSRGVANAAYTSGFMNLSGGTNAAPTGQGITDKNTLVARGCTITTN